MNVSVFAEINCTLPYRHVIDADALDDIIQRVDQIRHRCFRFFLLGQLWRVCDDADDAAVPLKSVQLNIGEISRRGMPRADIGMGRHHRCAAYRQHVRECLVGQLRYVDHDTEIVEPLHGRAP
jgi:hypothetical protein